MQRTEPARLLVERRDAQREWLKLFCWSMREMARERGDDRKEKKATSSRTHNIIERSSLTAHRVSCHTQRQTNGKDEVRGHSKKSTAKATKRRSVCGGARADFRARARALIPFVTAKDRRVQEARAVPWTGESACDSILWSSFLLQAIFCRLVLSPRRLVVCRFLVSALLNSLFLISECRL